jgi:hypothetical protein
MDTQEAEFDPPSTSGIWKQTSHDSVFRKLPTSLSVKRDKKPMFGMGYCTAQPPLPERRLRHGQRRLCQMAVEDRIDSVVAESASLLMLYFAVRLAR